ncbi:hypothetical protein ATZ36_02550 [Candidatus Endomicrobiellum trichonymphae]|uniref:Uncharacterized protein n=1 Tax=Endomicrobium trichonymphae TaxID=1408204 RepID=A0A1E5IMD0_ENDTX|nr:hypothetical protein ATZ36_02550 [Candidatus Endomicrobium trichonymphae]
MFACGCLISSPEYKKSWDDGNRIVCNVILQVVEGGGKKMKKINSVYHATCHQRFFFKHFHSPAVYIANWMRLIPFIVEQENHTIKYLRRRPLRQRRGIN